MENRSYFARLLAVALSALLLAAVVIYYQGSHRAGETLVHEFEEREANTAEVIAWLLAEKAPYAGEAALRARIHELGTHLKVRITYIAAGKVLADSDVPDQDLGKLEDHSDRPEIIAALASGSGKSTRFSSTLQTQMLYVARKIGGLPGVPDGVLRIASPYSAVQTELAQSSQRFLAVVGVMALCAAALAFFLIRRTQGALRAFSEVVSQMDAPEASDKIRVCPGSEFKPLMDSINTLAKRNRKHLRHLLDTRSQFEAVLAKMNDGVAILDEQGSILAHNDALAVLLGSRSGDCSGKHMLEAGLGLDLFETVSEALRAPDPQPIRFQARLADGPDVDVDVAPYATQKGKRRMVLVLHDVTPIKNAERILREFVIKASHELRTPLTSIQGFAATLVESPPQDQEQMDKMLGTILKRSQEMSGIVTDLLHTASPQAEKAQG
ncbi:histidine kinase dimerization/phospho-acceptor domain-containing protein [Fundidesulfovibrio soli]|uniref:histidine kinase dimerization/phospho-acceptor domain-containing protein n=1 Tax=Fundidesulfovibrio soli TaxID=2922716 RepID=UPI001FAEEEE9|nr:histidine kinase dimerization/phospho-acceptor domain-containing protein [Fundidesulfovibrio soli]